MRVQCSCPQVDAARPLLSVFRVLPVEKEIEEIPMKRTKLPAMVVIAAALSCPPATAATWCVASAGDLRAKLLVAANNGEDDTIKLVRGTYLVAGNEFSFNSTQAFGLVVNGGFNPGCTSTNQDARDTALDGGGTSQVLNITSPGSVALRYLTIRNGLRSGSSGGGLQMLGSTASSQLTLAFNILRDNTSDYAVGAAIIDGEGEMHINGNLVTGNHAPGNGGLYVYGGSTTNVYMTNNTFAGNTASGGSGTIVFLNYRNPAAPSSFLANNIFWSNTASSDLSFYDGRSLLDHNDYAVIDGAPAAGSIANTSVDPQFAGVGTFQLARTSPLLGAGTLVPAGGLPGIDLEGHPRIWNGFVDFGAYERGDRIFDDGFGP